MIDATEIEFRSYVCELEREHRLGGLSLINEGLEDGCSLVG